MNPSEDSDCALQVEIDHPIHASLRLNVRLRLGAEVGVLFGGSGAGKTTLLRLIAGLATPAAGRVVLDRRVLFDSKAGIDARLRDRAIGMIFQDDLLFPHRNVRDNVGFGLKGWSKRRADERIESVARLCGVDRLLDRRPESLSGGERQRVGLARSLAPRPRLLLCDEPVSALDLEGRNALIDRLKAVQRSEKIPVLHVTHSPAEAIMLGDSLFLMEGGCIADQGAPLEVLGRRRDHGSGHWEGVRNVIPTVVAGRSPDGAAAYLKLPGGPTLQTPPVDAPIGSPVNVEVYASDIILATGPAVGLSARNVIEGVVERVVPHGAEAEVIVRTGEVAWIAGVVVSTIGHLGLAPGRPVYLVVKARSCRIFKP